MSNNESLQDILRKAKAQQNPKKTESEAETVMKVVIEKMMAGDKVEALQIFIDKFLGRSRNMLFELAKNHACRDAARLMIQMASDSIKESSIKTSSNSSSEPTKASNNNSSEPKTTKPGKKKGNGKKKGKHQKRPMSELQNLVAKLNTKDHPEDRLTLLIEKCENGKVAPPNIGHLEKRFSHLLPDNTPWPYLINLCNGNDQGNQEEEEEEKSDNSEESSAEEQPKTKKKPAGNNRMQELVKELEEVDEEFRQDHLVDGIKNGSFNESLIRRARRNLEVARVTKTVDWDALVELAREESKKRNGSAA